MTKKDPACTLDFLHNPRCPAPYDALEFMFSFHLSYIVTVGPVNECSSISASEIFHLPKKLYAVKILIASSN